mgnify:CR=1 FL=1
MLDAIRQIKSLEKALYITVLLNKGKKFMRRSIIIAVFLFSFDAFVLNQDIIAFITLIIVLPILVISAMIYKTDKFLLKKRLITCSIYFIMAILILISNIINNRISISRANILIYACEKYKEKNNTYPKDLSALVPDFIDKIPIAKYTLLFNRFFYIARKNSHSLFYMDLPPFGRPTYLFERRYWVYID